MAIIKFINNNVSLKKTLDYIMQKEKTNNKLISGKDCIAENSYDEMMAVKMQYNKLKGRDKIHFIQSFSPDDELTYEMAHEIGMKMAEHFKGFQVVVATHQDRKHIHNHIVINTVNFENGIKFHQSKQELQQIKELSNKLCLEYGLTITDEKSKVDDIKINEYQAMLKNESWKIDLIKAIDKCMENSNSKIEFFNKMSKLGYKVTWTKERQNITFTTPDGKKCRDRKLHSEKYMKDNMEKYFRTKYILNKAKVNTKIKSKTYKLKSSMSFNFAQLIKANKSYHQESYKTYSDFGTNAQKEYLRKQHYSSEEIEM
ncbi:MAG: relaxase/mobilization nuclease domain-containing protein [Clostridia bacterium]|nr:relaxase/mobilization nuclease domain-containing protein [Clostridia bacterium]